jgi:hypothetical protein
VTAASRVIAFKNNFKKNDRPCTCPTNESSVGYTICSCDSFKNSLTRNLAMPEFSRLTLYWENYETAISCFPSAKTLRTVLKGLRERISVKYWRPLFIKRRQKVKVPLCFTKYHGMKMYWESGRTIPRILNLGTRWMWVISFTHRPLYPQRKSRR